MARPEWIISPRDTPMSAARAEEAINATTRHREVVEDLSHEMREVLTSFRLQLALTDRGSIF